MRFTIKSIETKNFRQFRGKQTIDFKFTKGENVAIIKGKNGAGKSNLLNALTWCFYGVESHIDSEYNEGMPIINTSEIENIKPNEKIEAEVKVFLDTDIGPWTIKRVIYGWKNANGETYIDKESKLTVVYPSGGQDKVETGDETQVLINNLLPDALKGFFFMDGEKLREFFKKDTSQNIADAVEKVSQLELMYKAAEHLEMYEKELRRSVKQTTPILEEINRKIAGYEGGIKKGKDNIGRKKGEVKKNKEELIEIKNFLKTSGIENVEKLERERETHEEQIGSWKEELDKRIRERNKYLIRIAPYIFLKSSMEKTLKQIYGKIEKGELPSRIKQSLVKELIEKGRCICGTKVSGETKKQLEEYSKKLGLSELSELSIVAKTKINDILEDINLFETTMDEHYSDISSIEEKIEKSSRRVKLIQDELKRCEDTKEIILKEKRREELIDLNAGLEQNIKLIGADNKVYNDELEKEKKNYEKELGSSKKNEELKDKLNLVQETLSTLATTEIDIKNKIRLDIQENTENNFFKLIRKKEAFRSIGIDDKYNVVVKHSSGYNVINHLSAGEYLILGLSFMSALMSISGFNAPVIIDTPLGKIDDEHRDKITKELPVFLENSQLILFVTPTEYDLQVQKNLSKFVKKGNFYDIKENKKNVESLVVNI